MRILSKIFLYIHNRAAHGNTVVSARWKQAERRFRKQHIPIDRCTARWHNKFIAGRIT